MIYARGVTDLLCNLRYALLLRWDEACGVAKRLGQPWPLAAKLNDSFVEFQALALQLVGPTSLQGNTAGVLAGLVANLSHTCAKTDDEGSLAFSPPDSCANASSGGAVFAVCLGGFDQLDAAGANDQTALQAALNSSSPTAVITNIGRPWLINSSLFIKSHKTIWMEPGVEIQARPGGFHCNISGSVTGPQPPPKACRLPHKCKCEGHMTIMSAHNVSNVSIVGYGATLRMHGADYNNESEYSHSEFRPAMVISGVTDFSVSGLTILVR